VQADAALALKISAARIKPQTGNRLFALFSIETSFGGCEFTRSTGMYEGALEIVAQ
jgi:hypothetical protein